MAKVDELSRTYDTDAAHTRHVTFLALSLFSGLAELHNFKTEERRLLTIAARLHDIGWAKAAVGDHNKASRDMILAENLPGLSDDEKKVCALIARYHTKSVPNPAKHRLFASLSPKARDTVEWLSAILRVADALDSSHAEVIKDLKAKVADEEILVRLQSRSDCTAEVNRAHDKEDLLVAKSGRKVVYQC